MSHMHDYSIAVSVRILESIPPDIYTVPDPDLEIGSLPKNTFWPFGAQFGPKKGGPGSPGPVP